MEPKKTEKTDLENKKNIFIEIGFIVALGLILLAFQWTSKPEEVEGFESESDTEIEQESVPITRQEQEKEPPPPPKTTEVINIVDDEVDIEDELSLETTEADQETEVSIDAFADQEEEAEEEEEIFVRVANMPKFKGGGLNSFRKWVQKNLEYPTVAAENGIEGTVYVKFVVNKDGSITNIQVIRGVDPSLNKEAVKTIKSAPKWKPGSQRGKPVRVRFSVPIVFELQ